MRIASNYAFQQSVSYLQKRYQSLTDVQSQMTSGLRVQVPSDDPGAAARAVRAMAAAAKVSDQQRALSASQGDMQLGESALGNASTLLLQARDLVVSAGNGTLTDTDRATIAQQLRGLRTDLLAQANSTDGNGRYLFGGQGADAAPFVDSATGVVYNGVPGQQQSVSSQPMPLTIDGRAAWMQAPDPANPGSSLSVFSTLDQTIAQLSTPGQTPTQVASAVSKGIAGIDAVSNTLSSARSAAGQALTSVDTISSQLGKSSVDAKSQLSNAQDLDMTQAISNFQNQQTGYDAALKTYSLVQQMSLFQYLK